MGLTRGVPSSSRLCEISLEQGIDLPDMDEQIVVAEELWPSDRGEDLDLEEILDAELELGFFCSLDEDDEEEDGAEGVHGGGGALLALDLVAGSDDEDDLPLEMSVGVHLDSDLLIDVDGGSLASSPTMSALWVVT
ncbi:hypothetical protein H632_c5019p0 [Helicosporidium sp. ATCC 50920]|nr:hypothetical protein H632_c5019p0 [Helicosporidium sp. ATCC 50920]|eukprot:KDD71439.1 hypothetical protein H632_c5019p0 [Helicosporidium sp. ATCC 50920]